MRNLVTNALYAGFVAATGHRAPDVDEETWQGYRLAHPYERTRQFAWLAGMPPTGREQHPVVLVSLADATAFAAWLSSKTGKHWSLPTEPQWEKAARGPDGNWFPWGNTYDPGLLNSHDKGPFTTMPVGSFRQGCQPLRSARWRGTGVRVDVNTCGCATQHRQGWVMG